MLTLSTALDLICEWTELEMHHTTVTITHDDQIGCLRQPTSKLCSVTFHSLQLRDFRSSRSATQTEPKFKIRPSDITLDWAPDLTVWV